MDESSKVPQSAASEQLHERALNHPRPFFYVQPPVQPYYTYQWHVNSPFSHHNIPASGFHFGRPYMVPYSYLQYPGYVVSQAAMHPVDHRRIYERNTPHGPSATAYDIAVRHQHCNAQRETTCAGAQTEPCDALNKLIECLDQLRAGESTSQRELDSGVVSQTSGVLSPVVEEQKDEDKFLGGSTLADYNAENTCHVEDFNQQEDWSLHLGKEPPLDSSSVHEEVGLLQEEDQCMHKDCTERNTIQLQIQSDSLISRSQRSCQDEKVSHEVLQTNEEVQWRCSNATQPSSQSSPAHPSYRTTEGREPGNIQKPPAEVAGDYPCCILRLPFEKVLSTGVYVPSTTSSFGSPFSYSYCPQLAHERVSVLSPSLDELSSHDEVLSTDMEDKDLFPPHIYTRGKFAEVASKKSYPSVGDIHSDMCLLYPKRLACAMCGSHTFRELSKHKAHHSEAHYYEDVDYSDDEAVVAKGVDCEFGKTCKHCRRGTVTKTYNPKRTNPLLKHRVRLAQHREKGQDEAKPGQSEAPCSEHFCCEKCMTSPEKRSGPVPKERPCRTAGVISDHILWESVARTKGYKSQSLLQRQERQRQRKACFKPQESRSDNLAADDEEEDDDDGGQEVLQFHKGKDGDPPSLPKSFFPPACWMQKKHTFLKCQESLNRAQEVDGMVVTAAQHPTGVPPHSQGAPHGSQPVHPGPRHSVPGSFRGPHPDRQQQHNWPFFYVQPSQPYLPYQWPIPMPYVPYGGFPGLGYGMMVPPFPPASYMEAPGYILPHAQLHMVDYRRMTAPHLPAAMAYQARRFRYQNTTPSGRVMVSSEVQTEPVCVDSSQRGCRGVPDSQASSESGRGTCPGSVLSSPRPSEDKSEVCPEDVMASNNVVGSTSTDASSAAPTSAILFQAEEVRIECSGTPSGLQIIHAKETTELASSTNGELLQCNVGSVHSAEDVVLRCYQPLSCGADEQREAEVSHSDAQYLPPCHDILMMGACPPGTAVTGLEGSFITPAEPCNGAEMHTLMVQRDPNSSKIEEDLCGSAKNVHFKILRLPFDLKCLDELRQMDTSVWSVESLVPYVPSTEWLIQNGLVTPQKPSLTTVIEVPAEHPLDTSQTTPDATSSLKENQTGMLELDGQDSVTSLESLPPYLPSASWLADFSNVYYNKLATQQQIGNLNSWPEQKLGNMSEVSQDVKAQLSLSPQSVPVKLKEKSKNRSRTDCHSSSNQDGCFASCADLPLTLDHHARICKSCLMKHGASIMSGSPTPKARVKRCKLAQAHLTGDKVNLCALCNRDPEKKPRYKAAALGAPGLVNVGDETEGEVSENSLYPSVGRKRGADGQKRLHGLQKLPSGRHLEKCPMSRQSKLREQNCSCEDPKAVPHSTSTWDTNGCTRYNATREKNEENLALSAERWRETERFIQTQKEKSRKACLPVSDTESTKSGGRVATPNKQKQCPQTQELHRRDTRC